MARTRVFLIGGGYTAAAGPLIDGPFVAAAADGGPSRIACVLLDGEDRGAHYEGTAAALAAAGAASTYPVFVSPRRPLTADDLAAATGVLVGGGPTPGYHDALFGNAAAWLVPVFARALPYAGYSAGAMIAPERAIVGGWKLPGGGPGDPGVVICPQEVSEDEEFLDVRPGLGLVPFAVDVHASHYGTLTRLLHALRGGAVADGWAIDEDTMLEVTGAVATVHGIGNAYRIRRAGEEIRVEIVGPGESRAVG